MKAFIEHDQSGLFYQRDGQWVPNPQQALAFPTKEDADNFRQTCHIEAAHAVSRLDPNLIARLLTRPPGIYQSGE
jgi:hypothetical protein